MVFQFDAIMVSEAIIEKVLETLEVEESNFEEAFRHFGEEQPELLQYLLNVPEGILTSLEREYLLYLAIIIWKSVTEAYGTTEKQSVEAIEIAEEKNWELWESVSGSFTRHLDVFFENTLQEDLLAFLEDSLTLDEENEENNPPITKEGSEAMFIILKTLIDVLTSNRS